VPASAIRRKLPVCRPFDWRDADYDPAEDWAARLKTGGKSPGWGRVCDFARLVEEGGPYHHHVEALKLTARVLSVEGGIARVRLEGDVRIKHRFYPGHDDQNEAVASLLGYLEFDAVKKTIPSLRLVTDRASYAGQGYGVAVRSLP
jgi:hypothetical protein